MHLLVLEMPAGGREPSLARLAVGSSFPVVLLGLLSGVLGNLIQECVRCREGLEGGNSYTR